MNDCRICLEPDVSTNLISPCKCAGTSKYVHETCLQRWRQNNRENQRSQSCEICNFNYIIIRESPLETYFIRRRKIPVCMEIIISIGISIIMSDMISVIDKNNDYFAVDMFGFNNNNKRIQIYFNRSEVLIWSYYQNVWCFFQTIILYSLFTLRTVTKVKNKCLYLREIKYSLLSSVLCGIQILYLSLLSNTHVGLFEIIFMMGSIASLFSFALFLRHVDNHNNVLRIMNRMNVGERIVSQTEPEPHTTNVITNI